ncbi:helix-turn-helix domain-containing protein [Chryseobacterium bernardetii]|uniref:helix-turn-helix domain-containing protein n=1 Tax=Chryseobacterium bernardetii TaxID=1241978 RepID=UPI000F4D8AD4|nr:Mu transposase C-terminal domain-containing protein [Chryseobacterium bernardetii]AZB34810.1 transposase [Chryseobacterium bernardetii]
MSRLKFTSGNKVLYKNEPAIIVKAVDTNLVTIQMLNTNIVHTIAPKEIEPFFQHNQNNVVIDLIPDKEWKNAVFRYNIVTNILENKLSTLEIKEIAKRNNIHYSTIYRWIKKYNSNNQIIALSTQKKTGGKNKSRLNVEVDEIINDFITNLYLNSSKKSIKKLIREINMRCKELDLKAPHENTIRNRLKNLSEEEVLKARYGNKARRDKFEPIRGNFPGADYPLSIVQLDHTCVDIILVDELYRKPFRRPYLTIAIDVFSRMVVGFHLSFDPPGAMGTGLCIANSILSKESILEKYELDAEWPCWGTMKTLHLDNAKEFRGNMLKKACQNYGINIEHRPVATPHWGGHVERLLGTFSKEIHNLSGSTFSNINERENYNSIEKASLTIGEFEKWLVIYIVNIYHQKKHSGIMMSPLEKFKNGIFGINGEMGTGLPPKLVNERRVRLDFMPFVERTIQEYGVLIDHITYYSDVLRKYIHSKEDYGKYSKKQKFIFKRDPRDISIIYFYDPNLNDYYDIPYRDTSKPPMSIWEYNETISRLQKKISQLMKMQYLKLIKS